MVDNKITVNKELVLYKLNIPLGIKGNVSGGFFASNNMFSVNKNIGEKIASKQIRFNYMLWKRISLVFKEEADLEEQGVAEKKNITQLYNNINIIFNLLNDDSNKKTLVGGTLQFFNKSIVRNLEMIKNIDVNNTFKKLTNQSNIFSNRYSNISTQLETKEYNKHENLVGKINNINHSFTINKAFPFSRELNKKKLEYLKQIDDKEGFNLAENTRYNANFNNIIQKQIERINHVFNAINISSVDLSTLQVKNFYKPHSTILKSLSFISDNIQHNYKSLMNNNMIQAINPIAKLNASDLRFKGNINNSLIHKEQTSDSTGLIMKSGLDSILKQYNTIKSNKYMSQVKNTIRSIIENSVISATAVRDNDSKFVQKKDHNINYDAPIEKLRGSTIVKTSNIVLEKDNTINSSNITNNNNANNINNNNVNELNNYKHKTVNYNANYSVSDEQNTINNSNDYMIIESKENANRKNYNSLLVKNINGNGLRTENLWGFQNINNNKSKIRNVKASYRNINIYEEIIKGFEINQIDGDFYVTEEEYNSLMDIYYIADNSMKKDVINEIISNDANESYKSNNIKNRDFISRAEMKLSNRIIKHNFLEGSYSNNLVSEGRLPLEKMLNFTEMYYLEGRNKENISNNKHSNPNTSSKANHNASSLTLVNTELKKLQEFIVKRASELKTIEKQEVLKQVRMPGVVEKIESVYRLLSLMRSLGGKEEIALQKSRNMTTEINQILYKNSNVENNGSKNNINSKKSKKSNTTYSRVINELIENIGVSEEYIYRIVENVANSKAVDSTVMNRGQANSNVFDVIEEGVKKNLLSLLIDDVEYSENISGITSKVSHPVRLNSFAGGLFKNTNKIRLIDITKKISNDEYINSMVYLENANRGIENIPDYLKLKNNLAEVVYLKAIAINPKVTDMLKPEDIKTTAKTFLNSLKGKINEGLNSIKIDKSIISNNVLISKIINREGKHSLVLNKGIKASKIFVVHSDSKSNLTSLLKKNGVSSKNELLLIENQFVQSSKLKNRIVVEKETINSSKKQEVDRVANRALSEKKAFHRAEITVLRSISKGLNLGTTEHKHLAANTMKGTNDIVNAVNANSDPQLSLRMKSKDLLNKGVTPKDFSYMGDRVSLDFAQKSKAKAEAAPSPPVKTKSLNKSIQGDYSLQQTVNSASKQVLELNQINTIVDKVYKQIENRLNTEKRRRGL